VWPPPDVDCIVCFATYHGAAHRCHRNVQALIEYAKRHGHVLAADDKGPMGVTALHLAALLPDNGAMAELLVLQCLPGEPCLARVPYGSDIMRGVPTHDVTPMWDSVYLLRTSTQIVTSFVQANHHVSTLPTAGRAAATRG